MGEAQKRGGVVNCSGRTTEDPVKHVEELELYPECKGDPGKSLRGRVTRSVWQFGKVPPAAGCRFRRSRDKRKGWNKAPGER